MIVSDVTRRARRILMDDIKDDYRNDDTDMMAMLQSAIRELVALRPALRLAQGGTLRDVEAMALASGGTISLSSTMLVDETYLLPLAYNVAEQVYREESADDFNEKRAAEMRAKFMDLI